MTPKRIAEIKAWSIYAREDCRHDDNCSNAVKCIPDLLAEVERKDNALRIIITESGKVDIDNGPAQQQICQAIARKALEQE